MSEAMKGGSPPSVRLEWRRLLLPLLWASLLIPWTWALLVPIPGSAVESVGGAGVVFWIGKTLHVTVYAVLAVMVCAMPIGRRWRLILVLSLIAHGGTSEYLQQFVQRGSSWRDFGLDSSGVLLGVGVWWLGRRYVANLRREPS